MTRIRGLLWLSAGLVVAILAGFVAFATLSQATQAAGPAQTEAVSQTQVLVAARPVAVRTLLTAEDLKSVEMPLDAVPEGAVHEIEDAVGKLTLGELYPGEVVVTARLLDPNVTATDGRTAVALVEDQVLMALPAQDLMSRVGVLKPGDHVDLLFSHSFPTDRNAATTRESEKEEQATFTILENLTVAALVAPAGSEIGVGMPPEAVLLTINPQDALVAKFLIDAGGTVDLVLRAPGVDRAFETDPVDVDYLINRYKLPIEVGR